MKLLTAVSVLACVALAAAGKTGLEDFWTRYGGIKIMKSCLTEEGTKKWIDLLHRALTDCNPSSQGSSVPVDAVENADWDGILSEVAAKPDARTRRSIAYSAEKIRRIKDKLSQKIETFRCVMRAVKVTDANNAVSTDIVMAQYRKLNISSSLMDDIEQAVMQCHAFTDCLPLEGRKNLPVPADVIKTKAFLECEKYLRYWACLKNDLKVKVSKGAFDFKGLDGSLNYLMNDESRAAAILLADDAVGPDNYNLYE